MKRATARASLHRTTDRQILTPEDMFSFCENHLSDKIKYFFVTKIEIEEAEKKLENRFKNCLSIPGTQKFLRYVTLNKEELLAYPTSNGIGEIKKIKKSTHGPEPRLIENIKLGQYVAAIYDNSVWYGIVEQYSAEFDDFSINFLHPSPTFGASTYYYPSKKDSCAIPRHNIVCHMSNPTLKGGSRIQYSFNKEEADTTAQLAKLMLHR